MTSPSFAALDVVDDGPVRWLTLTRPAKLNAVDSGLRRELSTYLRSVSRDVDVRCLVVTGAGSAFCAGADLAEFPPTAESQATMVADYTTIINQLRSLRIPTIACINGVAAGFGASLALACDLRYCSSAASLSMSFVKVGLCPDGGLTAELIRTVGRARAFEYFYTGRAIEAEEAERIGIVNQVVAGGELRATVSELAQALATGPRNALAAVKRSINHSEAVDFDDSMEFEFLLQSVQLAGPEAREGVDAFHEKRRPAFE